MGTDELEKSKLYDEGTPMSQRDGRTEDLTQHDRALQCQACLISANVHVRRTYTNIYLLLFTIHLKNTVSR